MKGKYSDTFCKILQCSVKPALYTPGEPHFWDDPYISKSLLKSHLNPEDDSASRRPETIDKEVQNLLSSGVLKRGDKVLDLGCGPGLYASRLADKGIEVTGVDISKNSLNYAIAHAKSNGFDIDYRLLNFLDIDFSTEFDAVIQVYGEFNTLSDKKRDELLLKLHTALKPGGVLIFDITTRVLRSRCGLKNHWYFSDGGFWRPGEHLVLEQGFDYPEYDTWLDQYIVIDGDGVKVYNNWFHDYTLESITRALKKAGFKIVQLWNDLTGIPYQEGGDWIAVVARRT